MTIDGSEIELSYKEFELLSYFMENQGIALSREKILNNVWNYDYFGDAAHRYPCEKAAQQAGRQGRVHPDDLGHGLQV